MHGAPTGMLDWDSICQTCVDYILVLIYQTPFQTAKSCLSASCQPCRASIFLRSGLPFPIFLDLLKYKQLALPGNNDQGCPEAVSIAVLSAGKAADPVHNLKCITFRNAIHMIVDTPMRNICKGFWLIKKILVTPYAPNPLDIKDPELYLRLPFVPADKRPLLVGSHWHQDHTLHWPDFYNYKWTVLYSLRCKNGL